MPPPTPRMTSASSGKGSCNALASSHGAPIQTSRSSSVIRVADYAFGWIGSTMAFGAVRPKSNRCARAATRRASIQKHCRSTYAARSGLATACAAAGEARKAEGESTSARLGGWLDLNEENDQRGLITARMYGPKPSRGSHGSQDQAADLPRLFVFDDYRQVLKLVRQSRPTT
jgi:hypothetical protein